MYNFLKNLHADSSHLPGTISGVLNYPKLTAQISCLYVISLCNHIATVVETSFMYDMMYIFVVQDSLMTCNYFVFGNILYFHSRGVARIILTDMNLD